MSHAGNFLQCNLRALRSGARHLNHATARKVAASHSSTRLSVEASRNGGLDEPTATLKGPEGELFLHSRYRPRAEADRFAGGTAIDGSDYLILYGFGLGYEAEALVRATPHLELRIIEPDASLLYSAFCQRDLREFLCLAQVAIICEGDVRTAVDNLDYLPFFFPKLRSTHLRARLAADDRYFKSFSARLDLMIASAGHDYRACAVYGHRWCVNSIRNLRLLERSEPLSRFSSSAKWSIVGAGPGADVTLGKDQTASTIYCDTAIRTANAYTEAELSVVTIDPQPISKLHYLGVPPEQTRLIADIGAHHSLLQGFPHLSFVSSGHPLHRYLSSKGLPLGPSLVRGGSVSETALRIAHYFGATEIALTGLDFAYFAEKSYVAGTWLESYLRSRSSRLHSISSQNYEFILKRNAIRRAGPAIERNEASYHTELLDDYKAAFLSAAAELGFTYYPAQSINAPALLRAEQPGSDPNSGKNLPPTNRSRVQEVLRGLQSELLEYKQPDDGAAFNSSYRTLVAASAALVPAAIYLHERRGFSRSEAMAEACRLMLIEISHFIADGR